MQPGQMHQYLKPGKEGRFEIVYRELDDERVQHEIIQAFIHDKPREKLGLTAGTYTVLLDTEAEECVMSDTYMEVRTNRVAMHYAGGHVLIAGLGLGMIIRAMEARQRVESITVLEKHPEIIKLVAGQTPFSDKVRIIEADVFTWKPDRKYDFIYFDIWNSVSWENYPEMKRLHRKYARALNRESGNGYLGSWRRDECRRMYKEELAYQKQIEAYRKRERDPNTPFCKKSPCSSCPYRTDSKLRAWSVEEFKKLVRADKSYMGSVYSCHKKDGTICTGFLMDQDKRRVPSLQLRILLAQKGITTAFLDTLTSKAPLYGSVREMVEANYPEVNWDKVKPAANPIDALMRGES